MSSLATTRTFLQRYRLHPTTEQEQRLARQAGARRWVWNWGLARRSQHYATTGQTLPQRLLMAELTTLKRQPETAWLREIDSQALQQALRDLDRAYRDFFAGRARPPRFKSKHRDTPSFRTPQRAIVRDGYVNVPKVGRVRLTQHRSLAGRPKSATFARDGLGHWSISIVCHVDVPDLPESVPNPDHVVGLDAGLMHFAVLSDGVRVANPRHYRRDERRLRKAQRHLARKRPGSRRRAKARRRVARLHRRIGDRRRDFLHQTSAWLVRQYDAIVIEDLHLQGLARTKLAKSFTDAGHGTFRRFLAYKCAWHGKRLLIADRWFPSSKMCHACGALRQTLRLQQRLWTCDTCGHTHDRDVNASRNLRRWGLASIGFEPPSCWDGRDVYPHVESVSAARQGAALDEACCSPPS